MGNLLETNALTKTFKGQTAVDHVSLHVPEGSVYGLLGPNGAGKSTLLKMVCGMLRPTSGSIAFAGRPWTRADLDGIGALIETPPLYDNLTARENLRVRTTLLGVPESRIDEALATVELAHTGSKRAGQFSLGMKQRLGIALALTLRFGTLAGIAIPALAQVGVGIALWTSGAWFAFPPATTLCAVAPLLGVAPSGVPLEAGDALGTFGGDAVLGIAVALALFAALAIAGAAWFSKREAA